MTTEPGAIAVALNITCVLSVVLSFRPWRTRYPGLNLLGDLCRETVLRSAGLFVLSNTEHDDPPCGAGRRRHITGKIQLARSLPQ
jgi:hypothetical protein